jgi:hypothetical protein
MFNLALPNLAPGYSRLAGALARTGTIPGARVYITEYFDPTRGQTALVSQGRFGILKDAPFGPLEDVTAAEATWASSQMLPALDQEVSNAAGLYSWHFVAG